MSPGSIREYATTLRPRYLAAARLDKERILTEFCRVTGYHRKSAIRLLRRPPRPSRTRRGRPRLYGPLVTQTLRQIWEASDYLCSKRLAPFLPELVRVLERHGELRLPSSLRTAVLTVSPPTIDRLLHPFRRPGLRRPHSASSSSPSLKAQVPIRTWGEWGHVRPGALQADLVAHCGESLDGFFLHSLVAVDVATAWTDCQVIWGKAYQRVVNSLDFVRRTLPFPLRELHTDNGGEFLNHILLPWCQRAGIRLTRGRPYRKNDQAHAEQRVWSAVRRLVGYDRYSSQAAFETLRHLYARLRLYVNFFQPTAKLKGKVRRGARIIKRYDRAQTPYRRLLGSGVLTKQQQTALDGVYQNLNPVRLRQEIQDALQALWKLADQPREVTPVLRQRPPSR